MTTLPSVRLGSSPLTVTRLGLGTWALGGDGWAFGWGPQDASEAIATIRYAVEHGGLNWLDTAPVYGLGQAEELVGEALADLPEDVRPYVFTKCGVVWGGDAEPGTVAGRRQSIERELDESLRRLRLDCIDLYQMHWPATDGTPLEEYWQTLADLRQKGKIRAAGLSNHRLDELQRAHDVAPVDSFQPPFSALARGAAEEIGWCASHSVGVITYGALGSGLLTGTFTPERAAALPPSDWRSRDPGFRGHGLEKTMRLTRTLADVAAAHGVSTSAVAIAWVLECRGVTGAIVGARRPEQIADWRAAATVRLSAADLDRIAAVIRQEGIGSGPSHPRTGSWSA
ncbi:aryl-alcohol dehydrogenase-like predicted oxidoreductase [Micromonospora sp. M71_S20]|uniref:aldo/keto reductase n=1 Tax=Micromonospora sp. M71_S20 TaxID=592872 RepID=UPI000EB39CB9|nr:aldo/keto reductase [Micromonospora sp. M71_S20]RLK25452.1 aryl-alcohol dehydrogenase-like predicted oxidoreductase [Micromonospora sp. M71_S20]